MGWCWIYSFWDPYLGWKKISGQWNYRRLYWATWMILYSQEDEQLIVHQL